MVFTVNTPFHGVGNTLSQSEAMNPLSTSNLTEISKYNTKINYPTRKYFLQYIDEFNKNQINQTVPRLTTRETPNYLKINKSQDNNPFSFIKHERIDQLRNREQKQRNEEKERFASGKPLNEKLPFGVRQRYTAAQNMRDLIYEENLHEFNTYGELYGPKNLTARQTIPSVHPQKYQEKSIKNLNLGPIIIKDKANGTIQSKIITDNDVLNTRPDTLHDFVQDRRKVCLLELMNRVKGGEIERLDKIMKAECDFLKKEEQDLLYRHEEHDRYLKSICQRTAEAIRLAEGEAHKKTEISDRIRHARYKLAHLNAECIKLEEEYLRLCRYRDFLDNVARTFKEHYIDKVTTLIQDSSESSNESEMKKKQRKAQDSNENAKIFDARSTTPMNTTPTMTTTSNISLEATQAVTASSSSISEKTKVDMSTTQEDNRLCENIFVDIFTSPKDLVNILSELESTNLTLIENVQEQEEACERIRNKTKKLEKILTKEKLLVDDHIEREKKNIQIIQENAKQIINSRNALNDHFLLDKYINVFYLGSIEQFQDIEFRQAMLTSKSSGTNVKDNQTLSNVLRDKQDTKPNIMFLLNILQSEVQKIYISVYGNNEGGAKLDTLVMLRRLETTIDELSEMLNMYPRDVISKARRAVEEYTRFIARRRQKEELQAAYQRRVEKAMAKAREKPRWRFGRRIMHRSKPKDIVHKIDTNVESVTTEDEDRSLFQ
uniref:DUF4200 domain-containing protein n=1 Tax=Trichobilharzia regenti TaxID=157069 RepID=A0AA85IWE5_TRIRE|nr:unnamed protein product [Trichobilharzia regenti]